MVSPEDKSTKSGLNKCRPCCCTAPGSALMVCGMVLVIVLSSLVFLGFFVFVLINYLIAEAYVNNIGEAYVQAYDNNDFSGFSDLRSSMPQAVVIVGNGDNPSLFQETYGSIVHPDEKTVVASASKLVTATAIYCVIEDANTTLTPNSLPQDYLPYWTSDPSDTRSKITIELMMGFRSGFKDPRCSHTGTTTWEQCVESIYEFNVDHSGFNFDEDVTLFEYGPQHLMVASLMALKAKSQAVGRDLTWDELLDECIIQPAGIEPAPMWREDEFVDGVFRFDHSWERGKSAVDYNPAFPELSGSLGCSPNQYAAFLSAFMGYRLVNETTVDFMSKSRGDSDDDRSELTQGYAQGAWFSNGKIHSIGYYGFLPWVDRTFEDDKYDHFVIAAFRSDLQWRQGYMPFYGVFVTLSLIMFGYGFYRCRTRERLVFTPTTTTA